MTKGGRPITGRAGIRRGHQIIALALISCLGAQPCAASEPTSLEARTRALELAYNLDQPESLAVMQQAVVTYPSDPAAFRTLATLAWLTILFKRGTLTVDDYLGPASRSSVSVPKPPPGLASMFRDNAKQALSLSEARLARNPGDVDALYELGSAVGLLTIYHASIEGQLRSAFRAARRAYDAHERVLDLDPSRKDAGLIVGTYRYVVATMAMPLRWVAYIAGFGGGRERGLRLVEEAAAADSDAQTEARFALVLFYNRERRYDDALEVLAKLQQRFPRNRLLWLESGATALRAGHAAQAEATLRRGLEMLAADNRERMFGEDRLWRYKLGATLVALGRYAEADEQLRTALAATGREWTAGRIHTELGKVADAAGRRRDAVAAYSQAIDFGRRDSDPVGVNEARRLKREPYRAR